MTTPFGHLAEAVAARDMVFQIGRRDVRLRYRQTRLGPLWLGVGPVVNAAVFTVVFHRIGKISPETDVPYFVFALCGLTCWTLFSQLTNRVSGSFLSSSSLVTRVRFPRLTLPASVLVGAGPDTAIGFSLVLVAVLWAKPEPRLLLGILGAGVSLLFVVVLAWELGLLIACLAVRRRDLVQILPIVLQLGLFATPVAYPSAAVPQSLRILVDVNPMATAIATFRASLLAAPWPTALQLTIAGTIAVGLLAASLLIFTKVEPCMADIL